MVGTAVTAMQIFDCDLHFLFIPNLFVIARAAFEFGRNETFNENR
jgi:hypothetical protein